MECYTNPSSLGERGHDEAVIGITKRNGESNNAPKSVRRPNCRSKKYAELAGNELQELRDKKPTG